MFEDKNRKKGYSGEENYQKGLQQENYLDSQIKGIIRNTRYYKTIPKKETISHAFVNLMGNIQEYNIGKI